MFAKVNTMGLSGLNAFHVCAEIEAAKGIQSFDIVGLGDAAVKEKPSENPVGSSFKQYTFSCKQNNC